MRRTWKTTPRTIRVSTSEPVTIVGLTGGIATGKSTVTAMFRDLGARVIDADVVAREVVAPGSSGLAEIQATFGDDVVLDDGSLNRAKLGELVFSDSALLQNLNSITHPRIAARMVELAEVAGAEGYPWVLYDAALLIENNIHRMLPATVVVYCSSATQLERLMKRDDFDLADARKRIAAQLPIDDKRDAADWVIDNGGTREATRAQVERVFGELQRRFGNLEND